MRSGIARFRLGLLPLVIFAGGRSPDLRLSSDWHQAVQSL